MKVLIISLLFFNLTSSICAKPIDSKTLNAVFDTYWRLILEKHPELDYSLGNKEAAGMLKDITESSYDKYLKDLQTLKNTIESFATSQLTNDEIISLNMLKNELDISISDLTFQEYQMPVNSESSFHIDLARLHESMPFENPEDVNHYLQRLSQVQPHINTQIQHIKNGMKRGFSQPRVILQHYPEHIKNYIKEDYKLTEFYKPFLNLPESITLKDKQQLQAQAKTIIESQIMPAYQRWHDFMKDTYLPQARTTIAAYDLPNGKAYYQQQIKEYTTLNLTPEEIHQIGLEEVKRIRQEMETLIEQTGFAGSFSEFLHFLRTDPQFYATSAEQLLMIARNHSKKMDGQLPKLFGRLPRQPYAVNPVPDLIAPNYTTGRYVGAPLSSDRPGQYWVNTYALEKRPLYNLEALTFHEAVPGHHLQISLSKELPGLPTFRQHMYISAFGEGWGLYSEKLAKEVGFYEDPYSDFGRLTYEMWRAMRLVVDTGMHAMNMTRKQAIQLMQENTALSLHNVETEIDRYIGWPGQALSYKLGELHIWKLRRQAEQKLKDKFNIRTFHDAVLSNGSIPLEVLSETIDQYIEQQLNPK